MRNKIIVITGSSSGIGKACAVEFAKRGAKVVISARNQENLAAAENELKFIHENILAVPCDVSKEDDCRKLIIESVEKFGGIDVLVNNAGISMRAQFEETDLNVLKKVMDINFWGSVYCTKHALPYLLISKGSIVGISSIAGKKGLPARSGYCASKFALEGFLQSVRIENLKNGLHVLIACPGFTASNIRKTALDKSGGAQGESPRNESAMMSADLVAEKIAHAVEKRKNNLVLTREGKLTVLLDKLFPSWVDRLVYSHFKKENNSRLEKI